MNALIDQLEEPANYFKGLGTELLPTPTNILLFKRTTKKMLQQEALQNRSHHRYVLAFNLKTDGDVHVDHLTLPFKPGQAVLILPYQFHHFGQLSSPKLQWLFCTFELEPRTFLEPLNSRVVDMGISTLSFMKETLTGWLQPHSELHAEQLQAVLLQLLVSLKHDRHRTSDELPPESEDTLIRAVNRLMTQWRGQMVVVADLAQAIGFSESRLRVLFKDAAGIPLGAYIQNYRINRAMALLRTSTRSITEVAEEAGFGSPQAFSRVFKNATGFTPRAYRSPNGK